MSRSKGKQFIYALRKRWKEYGPNAEEQLILGNERVKYVKLYQLGADGCQYLSKAKWESLTQLNLGKICINLGTNKIGDVGCQHLSKAKWGSLTHLNLSKVCIYLR